MKCAILALTAVLLTGCASDRGVYTAPAESDRDPQKAQALTLEAADLITSNPAKADRLLREALTADLYHGPAHNNLGVLYLKQGKLYEAAHEFEWAQRLLPGHPDPHVNLALTLERAGRTDEALSEYAAALEVYPGHIPATQGLVRLQVLSGMTDAKTEQRLRELAMAGETAEWREWARELLAIRGEPN